ncbi:hypothetical protein GYH30_036069 [Glycine max]|uniref:Uncharacterized protein n=1 Tax=Glycine max TaxID=3847 RepID=K7LZH6_SOYBN|nr:hypothetical protein GYH30_036069 [Glycine max]
MIKHMPKILIMSLLIYDSMYYLEQLFYPIVIFTNMIIFCIIQLLCQSGKYHTIHDTYRTIRYDSSCYRYESEVVSFLFLNRG